jgi:hypothetical protein
MDVAVLKVVEHDKIAREELAIALSGKGHRVVRDDVVRLGASKPWRMARPMPAGDPHARKCVQRLF